MSNKKILVSLLSIGIVSLSASQEAPPNPWSFGSVAKGTFVAGACAGAGFYLIKTYGETTLNTGAKRVAACVALGAVSHMIGSYTTLSLYSNKQERAEYRTIQKQLGQFKRDLVVIQENHRLLNERVNPLLQNNKQ